MATNTRRTVEFGRSLLGYWGTGFGKLKPAKWNVLVLRNAPAGQIDFQLSKGAVDDGYHFDTRAQNDAIWVDVDQGVCPPQAKTHADIAIVNVTNDCVTVDNKKCSGPVRLRYQLNVLDGSGNPSPIDPIIEN